MKKDYLSFHAGLGLAAMVAAIAVLLALPSQPVGAQEVTFNRDVAPILYENCVSCHREGSFAPMSLLTYDNARQYARRIRYRVATQQMPPWHVDQTVGIQRF